MFASIKNKININLNDFNFPNFFNRNNNNKADEQKKAEDLEEIKKIKDNKTRVEFLKNILSKYKFNDIDKVKIDLLLSLLEKN